MKKSKLYEIQDVAIQIANTLATMLQVDVEIIDSAHMRVAATGHFACRVNQSNVGDGHAYRDTLETGKKMFYICMIALCFIINYYLSAMSLIYIFLICGIRMVVMQERKQWRETAWNVGIGTIAGIGLSAFVLVPVFAQLSSSQRGGASKGLLSQYAGWITSSIVTDGAMAALQRWMMLYGLAFVIAVIIMGMKIYKSDRRQLIYTIAMLVVALGPVLMEATNLMWHFGSYNGYT